MLDKNIVDLTRQDKIEIIRFFNEHNGIMDSYPGLEYFTRSFLILFRNPLISYYLCNVCFSAYATLNNIPWLYSLHLFDIIFNYKHLQNIIYAITYKARSLLMTALLDVIMVYIYSSYGYFYIDEVFWNYDTNVAEGGENRCIDMFQCFVNIFS